MDWIYSVEDPLWQTIAATAMLLVAILALTRVVGLRSFAKFTAFDFAFTVAIGSVVAATLTSSTTVIHGIIAIGALLFVTYFASVMQKNFPTLKKISANSPLLLMDGNRILQQNMKKAQLDEAQLRAKLREANVLNYDQVRAVVLESTGDISVLHSADLSEKFDLSLLDGVKR